MRNVWTLRRLRLTFVRSTPSNMSGPVKGSELIVEFDALLGDIRSGGKKWSDQIKGIFTCDLFFDVTADAVGMLVPGGSIAVKLVKAVVDRGKR